MNTCLQCGAVRTIYCTPAGTTRGRAVNTCMQLCDLLTVGISLAVGETHHYPGHQASVILSQNFCDLSQSLWIHYGNVQMGQIVTFECLYLCFTFGRCTVETSARRSIIVTYVVLLLQTLHRDSS
jgi:hypothetical protein